MQAQAKDFCLRTEKHPATPQAAAAVIEAWLSDAMVSLPFDQDPGTAERFTELWAKAFKEVRGSAMYISWSKWKHASSESLASSFGRTPLKSATLIIRICPRVTFCLWQS